MKIQYLVIKLHMKSRIAQILLAFVSLVLTGCVKEELPDPNNRMVIDGTEYTIDFVNTYLTPETRLQFVSNKTGTSVILEKEGTPIPTYTEVNLLTLQDWYIDVIENKGEGGKFTYHYEKGNSYVLINNNKTYWTIPDAASIYLEDTNDQFTAKINLKLGTPDNKGVVSLYCSVKKEKFD